MPLYARLSVSLCDYVILCGIKVSLCDIKLF